VYLGVHGSKESRVRYAEIVAEVVSGQTVETPTAKKKQPVQADSRLTVNELVAGYLSWADGHFVKNGKPTSEIHCLKSAVKPLVELFGFTACDAFGPVALKAVREQMVQSGWCRKTCNKNTGRVRSIFRWGVENEMVDVSTLQKLQAVARELETHLTTNYLRGEFLLIGNKLDDRRPHAPALRRLLAQKTSLDRFGREISDEKYQARDFERVVALRARTHAGDCQTPARLHAEDGPDGQNARVLCRSGTRPGNAQSTPGVAFG
jgi:hypothetical protein